MRKITELAELESLHKIVADVVVPDESFKLQEFIKPISDKHRRSVGWLASLSSDSQDEVAEIACVKLNEHYKAKLAQTIAISPEIAFFLAADQCSADAKRSNIRNPLSKFDMAALGGHSLIFMLFPGTHAMIGVLAGAAKLIVASTHYSNELERIADERNQIARNILTAYDIAEDGTGGYLLKCRKWQKGLLHCGGTENGGTDISYPVTCPSGELADMQNLYVVIQKKISASRGRG